LGYSSHDLERAHTPKPPLSMQGNGLIRLVLFVQSGWLNKGVFISVGGRQPGGVIYETYLVG
jgi:hypothetical protein